MNTQRFADLCKAQTEQGNPSATRKNALRAIAEFETHGWQPTIMRHAIAERADGRMAWDGGDTVTFVGTVAEIQGAIADVLNTYCAQNS